MNRHPSNAALLAYSESRDHTDGDAAVRTHLKEGCARCQTRVRMFEEILASLRSPGLQSAPEGFIRHALDRIRQFQSEEVAVGDGIREAVGRVFDGVYRRLRRVQMELVLDSRLAGTLPGIRGGAALQPRQLLFESAAGSVHVQIRRATKRRFELTGQFIPFHRTTGKGSRVILEGERRRTEHHLGDTGEFRFVSVAPGEIRLALECGDLQLTAGPFEILEDTDA